MDTKHSINRTAILACAITAAALICASLLAGGFGAARAQDSALPEGWHDGVGGSVNAAGCSAFGWAVDPDDRDRDLQIQILSDGNLVATTTADLPREDLQECPGGTCGFGVNLWGLVTPGQEHQITAQAYDVETDAWVDLQGTPKSVTCWGYPEGFHDGAEGVVGQSDCNANGWAADPDDRDRDLQIRIFSDGEPVASTIASHYREDMDTLGICPGGTCAWYADLWGLISSDQEHQIIAQAYDEETSAWLNLEATPKSLTCQPPPPSPYLIAFPENEAVEGWEWPEGAVVHLAIDDPATEKSPDFERDGTMAVTTWGDPRTYVRFDFAGAYDLKVGDVVMLTDGVTPQTHVVQNLSVTAVDADADTVAGTADAGAVVQVWPHGFDQTATVQVMAGDDGAWLADFTGLFDLVAGTGGRSQILDEEAGNATAVDWYVHPRYTGHWRAVDSYDQSNMQLTISGGGSNQYQLAWTDDYWSACDGRGIGLGTGNLNSGGFLQVNWVIKCRGAVVWEGQFDYRLDADTGILWDDANAWYRVGGK